MAVIKKPDLYLKTFIYFIKPIALFSQSPNASQSSSYSFTIKREAGTEQITSVFEFVVVFMSQVSSWVMKLQGTLVKIMSVKH